MIEVINLILKWLMPPFFVYLVHPIFMGMMVPSKIHKWWQVVLLAAGVSLFNIPKMIWGIYSAPAAAFRVIATVVLMLVISGFCVSGDIVAHTPLEYALIFPQASETFTL